MDERQRYYRLLQLEPGATPDAVKRAFREQVGIWHPDRFAGDPAAQQRAAEQLRQIIEAYHALESGPAAAAPAAGSVGRRQPRRGGPAVAGSPRVSSRPVPAHGPAANRLFMVLVAVAALLAVARFGWSGRSAVYLAELLLIPALFSLAYNFLPFEGRLVRNLYVGFSAGTLLLVVVTTVTICREAGGNGVAAGPGDPSSGVAASGGPTGWCAPSEEPFDSGGSGPTTLRRPIPPVVPAPAAPLEPLAPLAPLVPPAR